MKFQRSSLLIIGLILSLVFLSAPVAAILYDITPSSTTPIAGTDITLLAQLSNSVGSGEISTAGKHVHWTSSPSGGTFSAATTDTDGSGVATVNFTVGTTAGTAYTITATDDDAITGSITITPVGGAATQIVANSVTTQSGIVGSAVSAPPGVIVKDVNNNPVSGVSVTFAVASGGGTATGLTATTNANGIATVGSWTLGATAGTNTLTATSGTLTGSPITFTATGGSSAVGPTITSITPSSGYNTSVVSITSLVGTGFSTSTFPTVRLYRAGSTNITASSVYATATLITCTFDITNRQAGSWDVVIINPTGESYTLANGFVVNSVASDATLSSITPTTSVTNTTISVTSLAGTGFNGTPSVYLKRSGYNDLYGTFTRSSTVLLTGTFNLTKVVPGSYQVCVVNPSANAVCGLTFTVSAMTSAANGTLYFKSSPSGADIYVNSVHRGTTPLYLDVTPGSYVIKITKTSYLDWADRVTVTSNNQTSVSASMTYQDTSTTAPTPTPIIITTLTTKPTVKSSRTVPTPWVTTAATPASPVGPLVLIGGVCIAFIVLRRR